MNIPLTIGDYKGRSGSANAMELTNMMVELDENGGAAPFSLFGTPGCKNYLDIGVVGKGRGGFMFPGTCLCIVGPYLYTIDTSTTIASISGTITTQTGAVSWAENPTQIMFVDGVSGYVYTKANKLFTKITDADFPIPLHCAFKDGFGVVVESSTGKIYVSGINDFLSWDALDFTTAEYEPDNLVSSLSSHDSLLAFGAKTLQLYYNSGNISFPFDSRQGANFQLGCGATHSPVSCENTIFWLDQNGIVRKLDGYTQQIVSTRQIEYKISQLSTFADARGFSYVQEGHTFYVLIFPTDELTLVYDLSTGQWHKRTSYAGSAIWRAAWIAQEGSLILAGDHSNGKIYQLDTDTFTDNLQPIEWGFTLQNINTDRHMINHTMLELHIESGVGLTTGQGSDPKLWMTYSDDDGNTWSHEKWHSMGKKGEYKKRVKFYGLGQARSRVYKIGGTDPVKKLVVSARLEGTPLGY